MDSKQFNRIRSNAQAEAGIERRKLRDEIERLRKNERVLLEAGNYMVEQIAADDTISVPTSEACDLWHAVAEKRKKKNDCD